MTSVNRRTLLAGTAAGAGAVALGHLPAAARSGAPALVRDRLTLPSGIQTGDVTSSRAVLWSRADRRGRLVATLTSGRRRREVVGPWATQDSDFTAKLLLTGLAPGREYDVRIEFEDEDGHRGEPGIGSFRTASVHPSATSFVWTGDTCGQGWGINEELGGLVGYRAMHETRPDFFIHAGDTIYADGPIAESVEEPDGQVWRNLVIPEVTKVAESLGEFRGRHRYNLMDRNVRAMYAEVPLLAQWDDHETTNNWYPGEVLDDDRYTERRVDVLASRARRAWQEYMPIAEPGRSGPRNRAGRGGRGRRDHGFAPARIYRKVERGPLLDVFCLDMRTHKSPNTPGLEPHRTALLGQEQVDWLVAEAARSRATWKVISADLPLGLVVPDGPDNQEGVGNRDAGSPLGREQEIAAVLAGFKRHGVRNVVWITADVHYCAAHHYDPARAAFTDFDPFWEIVAGPIAAGTFGPNELDATFGPKVEFQKVADYPNQSPRGGNQFFGHTVIDADGLLTVSLRNQAGEVLWSKQLAPERV